MKKELPPMMRQNMCRNFDHHTYDYTCEDCNVKARSGAIGIELPELIEAGPTVGLARAPHPAKICDQRASIAFNCAPWLP